MTSAELLSIGQVASATGLSVSAVRYYDELGLIAAAARTGGKRRFDRVTISALRFIRETQRCGFSLEEIRSMLQGSDWRSAVDTKLVELRKQRRRIDHIIDTLTEVRECRCDTVATCERLADAY